MTTVSKAQARAWNRHHFEKLLLCTLWSIYFCWWCVLRAEPLMANVLYFDDYLHFVDHSVLLVESTACNIPAKDYRWIYGAIRCFSESHLANFGLSVYPKLLGGLFLSAFCVLLCVILRSWHVPKFLAAILPLVILSHPIVNEITLWNTTGMFPLWLSFCAAAYYLFENATKASHWIAATSLLLVVVLAYELYFVVFVVLVVSQPAIKLATGAMVDTRRTRDFTIVFVLIAIFYIAQVFVSKNLLSTTEQVGRGLVEITSFAPFLREKIHGVFNIVVNVFMSPMSYYIPVERAWSLWKWLPIGLLSLAFLSAYLFSHRVATGMILSVFCVGVIVLPTLPILLSSQSPESWRVSVPVLISVCLVIALVCSCIFAAAENNSSKLPLALVYCALFILIGALARISYAEGNLRVFEYSNEHRLLQKLESHWNSKNLGSDEYHVGVIYGLELVNDKDMHPAQSLTIAYARRGTLSSLRKSFSWRGRLLARKMQTVEIQRASRSFDKNIQANCSSSVYCRLDLEDRARMACLKDPDFIQSSSGFRLAHLQDEQISVICM